MTIAKFSLVRSAAYILLDLLLCGLIVQMWITRPEGVTLWQNFQSDESLHRPYVLLGLIVAPLLFVLAATIFIQLVFQNSRAIWSENGRLFYLNYYGANVLFSSLLLTDVSSFSVGSMSIFWPRGVIATLRDGRQRFIPTILLSSKPEAVAEQLSNILFSQP